MQCQGWVVGGGGVPLPHSPTMSHPTGWLRVSHRLASPLTQSGLPQEGTLTWGTSSPPPFRKKSHSIPFSLWFPSQPGCSGQGFAPKMPTSSTRAFAWPRKTCFLLQEAFMAKHAHPAVFFQIPYSHGWLFTAGGLLLCMGWPQQDSGALGAGTGNGMMQRSRKQEPFMGAGSSALAPGDLWGRAGLSPTRGVAWHGVVAGDAGGDQHLAPSLPVPGG